LSTPSKYWIKKGENNNTSRTNRGFSTKAYLLDPWFITGFTDGEGCFYVEINAERRWVRFKYSINLHVKDLAVLEAIKRSLGGIGQVRLYEDHAIYVVGSKPELEELINHFNNYPLLSSKWADFELFCKIFNLVNKKAHLTQEGFE